MYKITLKKQIHSSALGSSNQDLWLEYKTEIPIPPFVGLEIYERESEFNDVIEDICVTDGEVFCFTHPNTDIQDNYKTVERTELRRSAGEIAKSYIGYGWELSEGIF